MNVIRDRHPGFVCREEGYNQVLPIDAHPELVLDVGGLYESTSWLSERFAPSRIIANNVRQVDLDSIPDEWAEKRLGHAEQLSDVSDVDLIFLGEVLEHLVYPHEFIEQAIRLLRPGGLLLLSTPNLATWHNRLLMLSGYSPSNYSMIPGRHLGLPKALSKLAGTGYGDHVRVFTYRALKELFSESPWELVAIAGRSDVEPNRPYYRARRAVSRILPPSARETVFICARLASKKVQAVTSTGFIGSSFDHGTSGLLR